MSSELFFLAAAFLIFPSLTYYWFYSVLFQSAFPLLLEFLYGPQGDFIGTLKSKTTYPWHILFINPVDGPHCPLASKIALEAGLAHWKLTPRANAVDVEHRREGVPGRGVVYEISSQEFSSNRALVHEVIKSNRIVYVQEHLLLVCFYISLHTIQMRDWKQGRRNLIQALKRRRSTTTSPAQEADPSITIRLDFFGLRYATIFYPNRV